MQSAVPHVLRVLDRTHDPERVPLVVGWAREAGLDVSLDLIYGTPGESLDDWRRSLDAALALEPDHLSAYALIVEDGTALARRIRSGELPQPDDDLQADMYELADDRLAEAGYDWYEVSNWATRRGAPVAAQPRLLDGGGLVGRRPRRAQPRRRRPLVEREAPRGLRAAPGRGGVAGGRPGDAGRADPRGGAGAARDASRATACRWPGWRRRGAARSRDSSRTASWTRAAAFAGRVLLTRSGRLLADAVVRRLLPLDPATRMNRMASGYSYRRPRLAATAAMIEKHDHEDVDRRRDQQARCRRSRGLRRRLRR